MYILLNFWNFEFGGFLTYTKGKCSYFKKKALPSCSIFLVVLTLIQLQFQRL